MSVLHPIISVTGSSGAGTTTVRRTFEQIFRREKISAAYIEGDAFHRYDREQMKRVMADEAQNGNRHFSHFGPQANLLAATARVAPPAVVFAATAVVGVGYAGCQVFPMAMLPDAAAVDSARTGENRAGVYTGVWTAGETLGLALGPAVFALVLALGGYLSSQGREITQPGSALTAITLGFSVLPAALTLASLWWLRQYTLDAAEVAAAEGALR